MTAGRIHIFGSKLSAVMIDGSFPDHCAYRPLYHSYLPFPSYMPAIPQGFVTFAESNVKALLTACGHQKCIALCEA
jgi:hypothetical protein